MKITYYGTAAGEAWPGVFCRCELCEKARALGGRNIRTRSRAVRLELAGLGETTLYRSSLTGEVRSGAGWMYAGLLLPRLEWDYSSALIVLEAV